MKILKLRAENIKRISAVEITPEGNLIIVAGKNAQGKSSTLDAILFALDWKLASKNNREPIKKGAESGLVHIELDDLIVERKFSGEKTYLKVSTKDGASYPSPQAVLDALIGNLSFDPLAFSRLTDKEQVNQLIQAGKIAIDLDEFASERKRIYDERTAINKQFKDTKALQSQIELPDGYEDLPDEEIKVSDLNEKLKATYEQREKNSEKRKQLKDLTELEEKLTDEMSALHKEIESIQTKIFNKSNERDIIKDRIKNGTKIVDALVDPDVDAISKEIELIEETNAEIRRKNSYITLENQVGDLKVQADQLTLEIEMMDKNKADLLKSANLPVKGLSFDDNGVIFNDVPFNQCSSAEQLKISLGIAMALNPKLRVIRIMDGSLLDKENLKVIEEMAKDQDFQIWVERVETDDEIAVIIEDGMVKEVKTEKPKTTRKKKTV